MTLTYILDFIVIGLLFSTLIYAVMLNRKLQAFYQSRTEIQKFLTSFMASLEKAEYSVQCLKDSGTMAFDTVQEHMNQAKALRDDLSFLLERGETIAVRLDSGIREARSHQSHIQSLSQGSLFPTDERSEGAPHEAVLKNLRHVR